MIEHENNGESLIRRYQPLVSEWSNPSVEKQKSCRKTARGTWGTETSKYPEEKKSYEIPIVAASEPGGV